MMTKLLAGKQLLLAQGVIISYCSRGKKRKTVTRLTRGVEREGGGEERVRERERKQPSLERNNKMWLITKGGSHQTSFTGRKQVHSPLHSPSSHDALNCGETLMHARTYLCARPTGKLKGIQQVTWQWRETRKRPWQWTTNQRSAELNLVSTRDTGPLNGMWQ